jgi:RimJ/RimL family protein N-acetyltransferase
VKNGYFMMYQKSLITVREARPEDAAQLVDFVTHLSEETELYIVLQPGEFTLTVEEEAELLQKYALSDNSAYFVAEANGQIVGGLNLKGGERAGTRHTAVLGISIAKGWRGRGIGS